MEIPEPAKLRLTRVPMGVVTVRDTEEVGCLKRINAPRTTGQILSEATEAPRQHPWSAEDYGAAKEAFQWTHSVTDLLSAAPMTAELAPSQFT